MLDNIEERLYTRLPGRIQPVAQKWYYLVNPRLSWQYRKKPDEVDESFVERFFADPDEYERYRTEFVESPLVDVCMEAEAETPEGYTVFDAHRKDAMKYYALLRRFEPDTVVESGVYNGVSTASILLALRENDHGRLHSVDYSTALREAAERGVDGGEPAAGGQSVDGNGTADRGESGAAVGDPDRRVTADGSGAAAEGGSDGDGAADRREYYERGRPSCSEPGSSVLVPGKEPGWILPDWLRERWTLTRGRPQTELPRLRREYDAIDVYVHDSEHSTSCMLYEFELAWDWLDEDGLILSSHIQWNDAFDTFVDEHDCEAGLTTFHYLGYEGEAVPCSTGYVRKV